MADSRPIGVFDSGIGGLTVLREIARQHPAEACIYLADEREAPYGAKPAEFLQERCARITQFLLEQGAKAIVVACNTASVAALPGLRAQFDVPFVGIVPAVKPAAAMTRTGTIGVLATTTTVASEALARLIETYAHGERVITHECPRLVGLVEAGVIEGREVEGAVAEEVGPLLAAGADVLVLGCTHLPFLAPALARLAGPGVRLVDPVEAVARQLGRVLDERDLRRNPPGAAPAYYSTDNPDLLAALLAQLMGPLAGPVRPVAV